MSDLKLEAVRKEIAAYLLDCLPESLLAYKDKGDEGFVAIAPTGQKYTFSVKQLEQGLIAMDLDKSAKAAEQARAMPEPQAEPPKAEPPSAKASGTGLPEPAVKKRPARKRTTKKTTKP